MQIITVPNSAATEPRPITPQLRPSRYEGERGKWDVDLVLATQGGRRRWAVGYVDATGSCRREYQGPVLPGPYAYAYELGWSIASDPRMSTAYEVDRNRAAGTEVDVEAGQIVRLGWELFRVTICPRGFLDLEHVGSSL